MSDRSTLDRALELQRHDRVAEGESLLRAEVAKLERQSGRASLNYEVACGELGTYLWLVGNQVDAIEVFRELCAAPLPTDGDTLRNRLTQLMNFGELLTTAGELDEAERILEQGLAGRLQYYGREHPGYGFGLEPLAGVWLYRGKFQEALDAIDETIEIFANSQHERIIGAIVLRSEILKTAGVEGYLLKDLEAWDEESIEDFARSIFLRINNFTPPPIARLLLLDLTQLLKYKFDRDAHILLLTYGELAELERKMGGDGDPQIRQGAIHSIHDSYQRQGNTEGAIEALMGLSCAQADNEEIEAALTSYSRALALAESSPHHHLTSRVMRNYGLFLKEIGQKSAACGMLENAISFAKTHNEIEAIARSRIALGVFLQHEGDLASAQTLLQLGIADLNPSDPDRVCGFNHLRALERGIPCCSEAMPDTILESCREFILSKIPADKIKDLQIEYSDDGLTVHLDFADAIDDREGEEISRQVNYAFRQFQQNLTRS